MRSLAIVIIVVSWCSSNLSFTVAAEPDDPLAAILRPVLKPTLTTVLETYRNDCRYPESRFPFEAAAFAKFRADVISNLETTTGMSQWTVRKPRGKTSPIAARFRDRLLKTITHHGVTMEVHAVTIKETGLVVPMVVCLPAGTDKHPGVCVFSGHTKHGLKDLVLDLESYQRGVATRLAQAGFVSIAVEKIDTGYLSRNGADGVDENELTTFGLSWGRLTRTHQLMACQAATEILAGHSRVDETKIGATGVSLGGWLTVQTALLNDRIAAVADFGRKTRSVPADVKPEQFRGLGDLCHIMPGMLAICDRNVMSLAYCPRPMLAGHGRKDTGSHREGPVHYQQLYSKQYATLRQADQFQYHIHKGGDTMPDSLVIDYFRRQFGQDAK